MIKPKLQMKLCRPNQRDKVYFSEYAQLEKYCEHVEGERDGLKVLLEQSHNIIRGYQKDVNQYSKLSNDSDEIESIKGAL